MSGNVLAFIGYALFALAKLILPFNFIYILYTCNTEYYPNAYASPFIYKSDGSTSLSYEYYLPQLLLCWLVWTVLLYLLYHVFRKYSKYTISLQLQKIIRWSFLAVALVMIYYTFQFSGNNSYLLPFSWHPEAWNSQCTGEFKIF